MSEACIDPVVLNDWHPVGALRALTGAGKIDTRLLGRPLHLRIGTAGNASARLASTAGVGGELPVVSRYGLVWTCLGEPARSLFELAEADEDDRRRCDAGSPVVNVGGLRVIENFLDMAHFPFIHAGILGEEPYTEVTDYGVTTSLDDGVQATECRFHQPRAALNAVGAIETQYVYRVIRPFSAVLYKTSVRYPDRMDLITLFVQPVSEESCIAHMWLCLLDDASTDAQLRTFQCGIFGQDRQVLEGHLWKRLPLDAGMEFPVRADAASIAYRRWLRRLGLHYGTMSAADVASPAVGPLSPAHRTQ